MSTLWIYGVLWGEVPRGCFVRGLKQWNLAFVLSHKLFLTRVETMEFGICIITQIVSYEG